MTVRTLIAAAAAFGLAACAAATTTPAGGAPMSSEIEAAGPAGPLKGTLLAPAAGAAKAPLVLILPGSGPTNRDGDNSLGLKPASYRLLAEALAERGIASVRIDKRGMFGSAGAAADANAVTVEDYVADTRAWIASARRETGAQCVWLLGHSEGGLVALAAAREDDVCGLVLVAAPGRRLSDVLRTQLTANPANAPVMADAERAIAALEKSERVDVSGFHPALQGLFAPQVQGFLISLFAHDPAALLAGYGKPVLIVQGETDIQVTVEDARRLAAANSGAKLVLLPDVNHVLKTAPAGDQAANLRTYSDPALPLAPGVADAIAGFVRQAR
ncbi:MAG: alpha/beta hydrolase [Allosphingosinicella sp.]